MMSHIAILPYRKLGFARKFGFTVRDLMILRILEQIPQIESINWFERPGLPHEFLRDYIRGVPKVGPKVEKHVSLDTGLLGAWKKRRAWTHYSMTGLEPEIYDWQEKVGSKGILLDFNPFYVPPRDLTSKCYYWYDLIDTFTKHNLYSSSEKAAVTKKYEFVKQNADLVTGVTSAAVAPFNGKVLANRLLRDTIKETTGTPEYDVGFLGFITNKFDLDFVRSLAERGIKILVCGHSYDTAVTKELSQIANVKYHGSFSSKEVPTLISQFKIGMVPYRSELKHDESPIKFFQYIAYGRPALLSSKFNEIETAFPEAVHYYDKQNLDGTINFIGCWNEHSEELSATLKNKARNMPDLYWDKALSDIIGTISEDTT